MSAGSGPSTTPGEQFPEDTQILLVAHPPELALHFLQRLHSLPLSPSSSPSRSLALTPNHENRVPFTISNKYYTAPVYFQLQALAKPPALPLWPPEVDDERARAVLWVFRKDEHDPRLFDKLLPALEAHGAEVKLAVGITSSSLPAGPDGNELSADGRALTEPPNPVSSSDLNPPSAIPDPTRSLVQTKGTTPIDGQLEDELEQFFLKREFEYVDADYVPRSRRSAEEDEVEEEDERLQYDVVGLPRVLESLSTVMWPSMIRKVGAKKPLDRSLFAAEYEPTSALAGAEFTSFEMDGHLAAEEEEAEEDDPAAAQAEVEQLMQAIEHLSVGRDTFEGRLALATFQKEARSEKEALEAWLDDDADADVGAQGGHGKGEGGEGEDEFGELVTAGQGKQGAEWAELENEQVEGYAELEDDAEDDGLPSEAEIVRTHLQIFGPPPPPPATSFSGSASAPRATANRAVNAEQAPRPEDYEQDFDLTSALGALQSMRDEIRGMTDEGERRRAAARVALGLVHGLGLDEGDLEDVMRHG